MLTLLFVTWMAAACEPAGACTLQAHPAPESPTLDGVLDEPAWAAAPAAGDFRQYAPREGAPASLRTEVRVLYGARALYVGARLYDDRPEAIRQTLGRRDAFNQADWFEVSIDTYLDRRTAFTFAVNAAGVQVDGLTTDRLDTSWDAVWDAAARVDAEGWTVEMAIPYSMLRFPDQAEQAWGINFRRRIPRLGETAEWSLVRRTERERGPVSQYGRLEGLRGLRPRRNVQVTPYLVASAATAPPEAPGWASEADVGGDLKVGLSSALTLDATINPDFGQVEADPAELNLSAFETFFPERRPFFLEGVQIFEYPGALLYTRRIGGAAPILGAAKLTGRTPGGLAFGVLGALTGDGFDPSRSYGAARLRKDFAGQSSLGALATGLYGRDGAPSAFAAGADWDWRLAGNRYQVEGHAELARRTVAGRALPVGFSAEAGAGRIQGAWTYDAGIQAIDQHFNPNDLGRLRRGNMIRLRGGVTHQLNRGRPFGPFASGNVSVSGGQSWSYREHISQGLGLFVRSNFQTRAFRRFEFDVFSDYLFGGYDLFEARGLGPVAKPREVRFSVEYGTDSRRRWELEPEASVQFVGDGSHTVSAELQGSWSASDRLDLSASLGANWEEGRVSWASNEAFFADAQGWAIGTRSGPPAAHDPDARSRFDDGGLLAPLLAALPVVDGGYHVAVFGARDTRSADLTLRGNWTFSPRLTVQLFTQLFAARGRFGDYRLRLGPDDLARFDAYPKQHDFAFSSFLLNAVLRWEYRPGSALYVVWSQGRDDDGPFGPGRAFDRPALAQVEDLFGVPGANTLLVKLNYTFLY